MNTDSSRRPRRRGGRNSGGGQRRDDRRRSPRIQTPPAKQSLWDKIVSFIKGTNVPPPRPAAAARGESEEGAPRERGSQPSRRPERVEVTSPRLYVGNLSYDATESDLYELFAGVGTVQNAEIVSNHRTMRSKGFGFVEMQTTDEAKRAVDVLHDKDFMGRKLLVSGAKSKDSEGDG